MRDSNAIPELPTLDPGVQLLDADGERAVGPLDALVLDHVLCDGGTAYWVDSRGHAQTGPLTALAPSDRALDRVQIARGFTAYQHFALVGRLRARVDDETALVVLPALDATYRADDVGKSAGRAMLLRSLATLRTLAREHDIPVLVTRTRADSFTAPLSTAAARTIECRQTAMGPRFVTDEFETLVYPDDDGTVQTTIAFWQSVLAARQPVHEAGTVSTSVTIG